MEDSDNAKNHPSPPPKKKQMVVPYSCCPKHKVVENMYSYEGDTNCTFLSGNFLWIMLFEVFLHIFYIFLRLQSKIMEAESPE